MTGAARSRFRLFACVLAVAAGLFAWCGSGRSADAQVAVDIRHSRAFDVFVIMDELSQWRQGLRPEYRQDWEHRFGPLTPEDLALLETYAQWRRADWERITSADASADDAPFGDDGLFNPRAALRSPDALQNLFRDASSPETALRFLRGTFGDRDGAMLSDFYRHFQSEWSQLLEETAPLDALVTRLRANLGVPGFADYALKVSAFYGVTADTPFVAFIAWWPPVDFTAGAQRNGLLIVQINPVEHAGLDTVDTLIAHEFVHFVSAHQTVEARRRRTADFL